jgi:radical SAM protein with 4Fe4S-binding SPASM domain
MEKKDYNEIALFHPKALLRRSSNGAILCNKVIEGYSLLTPTQAFIATLLDGSRTVREVSEIVAHSYGVESERAYTDVLHFLKLLEDNKKLIYLKRKVKPIKRYNPKDFLFDARGNTVKPDYLVSLGIALTESCPLRCIYCFANASNHGKEKLSVNEVIRVLREARDLGAEVLMLSGGEPFLHEGLVEIVQEAIDLRYSDIQISTGGTVVDEGKAEALRATGLKNIQLSIDSNNPETYDKMVGVKGAYERMLRGLLILLANDFTVRAKTVLTALNLGDIPDLCRDMYKMDVRQLKVDLVAPIGRAHHDLLVGSTELELLMHQLERLTKELPHSSFSLNAKPIGTVPQCAGAIMRLFVCPDGYVTFCDALREADPSIMCGNIREQSLQGIWFSERLNELRKLRADDPRCLECPHVLICNAGCRLRSFGCLGDPNKPDPLCGRILPEHKGELFTYARE